VQAITTTDQEPGMCTPTVTETTRSPEPTTRDDFADSHAVATAATIRRPAAHRFVPDARERQR
jgi:hypothetical protein